MKKELLALLFLCVWLLPAGAGAEKIQTRPIYELPVTAAGAGLWQSADPSRVAVDYVPPEGENPGAIRVRILQAGKTPVELSGPEFKLEKQPEFVTSRRLELSVQAWQKGCGNGAVQFRIRQSNGRWAVPLRPRRDWDTVMDMVEAWKWNSRGIQTEQGTIANDTVSGRLVLWVDPASGKGEFLLEKLKIDETDIVNHKISSSARANTFFENSGSLTVRWFAPDELLSGKLTVRNENQEVLQETAITPRTRETTVPLPKPGFYEVVASARYKDGSEISSDATAGVVGSRIPEDVRKQSRYGVMRVHASGDWAKEIGSNIDWGFWTLDQVAPGPDGRLVSHFQKPASTRRDFFVFSGMNGVFPTYLQSERAKNHYLFPPKDWKLYSEAVEVWARDNPDLPDVVCVYNEPNAHWQGTEEEMVRFHNETADAVKRGRPGAKVGGPVLYSVDVKAFKRYVEKGILRNMDYVVMHAYVPATPPETDFIERIIAMQEYLATTEYRNLPVALTEFGWTGYPGDWQKPVSELDKARYCVRSLLLCTARNIDAMIYFNARYVQAAKDYNYSMVKPDYTPLPAFVAFSTMLREMSTVKGGGQYFKLAPGVFWTGFKRDGKALAALWTSKEDVEYSLPEQPETVTGMTGGMIAPNRRIALSPSPCYVTFQNAAIADMKILQKIKQLPGNVLPMVADEIMLPPGLSIGNGGICFPATAPLGEYTIILRRGSEFYAQPVTVIPPVEIAATDFHWNGRTPEGHLEFASTSALPGTAEFEVKLIDSEGKPLAEKTMKLPCGETVPAGFDLSVKNGKRATGRLAIRCRQPIDWTAEAGFDITPLAAFTVPKFTSADWAEIPGVDVAAWSNPAESEKDGHATAKAELKLAAAPDGLHLRLTVHDDYHIQNDRWNDMWKEDSIQVGFDLDADREWEPNNVGHGLNGHRVVEYGIASRRDGKAQGWCFLGCADGIKSGPAFELMKTIRVVRNEADRQTVYEVLFPWKLLGADSMPKPGTRIGFALLINDTDQTLKRKMLRFFDGIASKDPTRYGKLIIGERK